MPENTAALTTRQVMDHEEAILLVCHDSDGWQFIGSSDAREEDAVVVAMGVIVDVDRSVEKLANLPEGWYATRKTKKHKWVSFQREFAGD